MDVAPLLVSIFHGIFGIYRIFQISFERSLGSVRSFSSVAALDMRTYDILYIYGTTVLRTARLCFGIIGSWTSLSVNLTVSLRSLDLGHLCTYVLYVVAAIFGNNED
jgi:hypothetical protein